MSFTKKNPLKLNLKNLLHISREKSNETCKKYKGLFLFNKLTQTQMQYSANWFLRDRRYTISLPSLILLKTFQLCKYSSCCIRLNSSLFTHALSFDCRQRGDPRYSTLSWMNLGMFAVNIICRPRGHWLTARVIIQFYRELWNFLSSSSWMFDIYLYTSYALYPRNLWGKLYKLFLIFISVITLVQVCMPA